MTHEEAVEVIIGHHEAAVRLHKQIEELEVENARLRRNEKSLDRLIELGHSRGWNGTGNSKILDVFLSQEIAELEAERDAARRDLDQITFEFRKISDSEEKIGDALDDVLPGWEGEYGEAIKIIGEELRCSHIEAAMLRDALETQYDSLDMGFLSEGDGSRIGCVECSCYAVTQEQIQHTDECCQGQILAALAAAPTDWLAAHAREVAAAALEEAAKGLYAELRKGRPECDQRDIYWDEARDVILDKAAALRGGAK